MSLRFAVLVLASSAPAVVAANGCSRFQRDPFENELDAALVGMPDGACGLACKRVTCQSGATTRITGRVTDPAGARGLYNVSVYIPSKPPPAIEHGARCDACARRTVDAVVSTLTDVRGEFVLPDAPVDVGIPIVIETGKWRRVVTLDVAACVDNQLSNDATRLPRNTSEGELPLMAVTTGTADALECLLRNVGIDEREFVAGNDPAGRVHLYRGRGGGGLSGTIVPPASDLWNDATALARYDVVALSCEGDPADETKSDRGTMYTYANAGGHIFASHFHSAWLAKSPSIDFSSVATWSTADDTGDEYIVDTSFPKGVAFAEWLVVTGASTTPGRIRLDNVTFSVGAVRKPPAQGWIHQGRSSVRYFSFNTPVGAGADEHCGRVVFADLHAFGLGASDFPVGCPSSSALTPQQLALEFLLFDLFGCVLDDAATPAPPR